MLCPSPMNDKKGRACTVTTLFDTPHAVCVPLALRRSTPACNGLRLCDWEAGQTDSFGAYLYVLDRHRSASRVLQQHVACIFVSVCGFTGRTHCVQCGFAGSLGGY